MRFRMPEPRVAIVGTGRSGSGYIAKLLNEVGVVCGHEEWWNPFGERRQGLDADSSWCAIPELPNYDGVVLHQVRHPLSVIASHVKRWSRTDDYWPLKSSICRRSLTGDDLIDAASMWIDYNQQIEESNPGLTWRVESLGPRLLHLISHLCNGVWVPVDECREAMGRVPNNFNSKPGSAVQLTWDDLPVDLRDEAREMARRYGYTD